MNDYIEPLVSVVIPMYNREKTIERAVESVLNQTYKNLELIIVDDCSTDMSVEIVNRYLTHNVKLIVLPHNCGANAARNTGIKEAKGDFIAFQDSDDEWLPDKLKTQIDFMIKSGYKALFCPFIIYNPNSDNKAEQIPSENMIQEIKEGGIVSILRMQNVVSTQTLVIDKGLIESVGMFDETMPRLQDYEYIIRIVQKYEIGFVEQPLVKVYQQKESITNDVKALYDAYVRLLEKHSDFLDLENLLKLIVQLCILLHGEKFSEAIKRILNLCQKNNNSKRTLVDEIIIENLIQHYTFALGKENQYKKYINSRILGLQGKDFAIYGAGIIAKSVYFKLKQQELYPQCFIISEKSDNDAEKIEDIPIKEISVIDNKGMVVIIAVDVKYQEEILNNLLKWKFDNYFILDNAKMLS